MSTGLEILVVLFVVAVLFAPIAIGMMLSAFRQQRRDEKPKP